MPPGVAPDYRQAVSFLQRWRPSGPWVLTSIHPQDKKSIAAAFFSPGQESQLLSWLEQEGVAKNLYFSVNPVLRQFKAKAAREDVAALEWLHVDIDPRPGEEIEAEQVRALELLQKHDPPPTVIVFSGGGYQGFWKLADPMPIDGQPAAYEEAAAYNKQLEILFGADHCHNVDRIMRLPGTVNRPDEKKRKKGRKPALAHLVSWDEGRVYALSTFQKAVQVQANGFAPEVKVSGNVQRISNVDELPDTVSLQAKVVIVQGLDPDNPGKFGSSRSEWLFFACCEMVRGGCTDDQIFAVITDPEFRISASVLDKGSRSDRYALRQIERAREEAVHPVLRRMNEEYAVIGDAHGKCRVVWETVTKVGDQTRPRVSYRSFEDFANYFCNQRVEVTSGQQTVYVPAGKWWLQHPLRRTYRTVVFAPGKEVEGAYNLWRGFAFDARPGDCGLYLQLVRDVICARDERTFDYLMGWMASAVQRPDQPGHTAIVLRGRQGTGKGVFAKTLGKLFGRHFFHVSSAGHLVGNFNLHLRDCVVLFADEALFAGDKKHESVLKTLVTEETLVIEKKGADVDTSTNFLHIIMASNEKWVVPAGLDDRRFVVLDVDEAKMQDLKFFPALVAQLEAGGYEALLHCLLTYDLSTYEPRLMPKTRALQEQKIYSFSAEEEWWFSKLTAGEISPGKGWPEWVFATQMSWDYTSYSRQWQTYGRTNSTRLGRFIRSVFPANHEFRGQLWGVHTVRQDDGGMEAVERPRIWLLPKLEVCRGVWDSKFGGPYEWPVQAMVGEPEEAKPPF